MFMWMSACVCAPQCVVPEGPRGGIRARETMTGSHTQELRIDCLCKSSQRSPLGSPLSSPIFFYLVKTWLVFSNVYYSRKVPRAAGKKACSSVAMSSTLQMSAKSISTTMSLNSGLLRLVFFWGGWGSWLICLLARVWHRSHYIINT